MNRKGSQLILAAILVGAGVGGFVTLRPNEPVGPETLAPAVVAAPSAVPTEAAIAPSSETDSASVVTPITIPTTSTRVTTEEFKKLRKDVLRSLPTLQKLRALSDEEVHGMPEPMREAGIRLGKIAQALHDNPDLAEPAREFYSDCLTRVNLPSSVRALCYSNFRNLSAKLGRPDEHASTVPQEIRDLADRL